MFFLDFHVAFKKNFSQSILTFYCINTNTPQSSLLLFLLYIYILYIYFGWNNLYFMASAIIYMLIISKSVLGFLLSSNCLLHIPYSAMYLIDSGSMCVHSCIFPLMPSFLLFPIPNGILIYVLTQARNFKSTLDSFISFNAHI